MKKLNLKKIITMGLITTSILAIVPVGASAEWRQSNNSWWYTKANGGYATGWEKIGDSWYYFDNTGYMKEGWVKDCGNWYYLKADGTMATGTVLTDGQISSFTSGGIWTGYVANNNASSNTANVGNNTSASNNTNTSNSNNNSVETQATSANNDFTYEKAIEILNTAATPDFYISCFGPNYEFTKGGYNGYPVEDKIYINNNGTEDLRYRIIGVIDKVTGRYCGILKTYEKYNFAEVDNNTAYYDGINLETPIGTNILTFDKNGACQAKLDQDKIDQAANSEYLAANPNKPVLTREQQEEINIKAMHPDWVTN